jgi:flagellar biosynthesis chaperone FliJ
MRDRMARQRREELVHAAREARLLEKLKDRHEERCREELRCAERVAIDEIAARYAGGR